jgi:hypothetical protein
MNPASYPAPIKTWLKATPAFIVFSLVTTVWATSVYATIRHPHDRVERFFFRSNKYERLVRKRDEKLRIYFKPAIDWQPNASQKVIQVKPLFRY